MTENAKPTSLIMAIMHFFGKKPGQTTQEFAQEIKALTQADREEFRADLIERGYPIV